MSLKSLLRQLGLSRLAARLGVTPATVRRWLRHGASEKGRERLAEIAKRSQAAARRRRAKEAAAHEAAQQVQEAAERRSRAAQAAAATRRKRRAAQEAAEARRAVRDRFPVPVFPVLDLQRPTLGNFEDPSVLVPDARPIETREELREEMRREGHDLGRRLDNEQYFGEKKWENVGKPIVEVPESYVFDTAMKVWHNSIRRWIVIKMLFFRYIPFNPLYRGELLENNGKWRPWWTSTMLVATPSALSNNLHFSMAPAYESAQSRLIWFEGFRVDTFDFKTNEPKQSRFDRQMRTS